MVNGWRRAFCTSIPKEHHDPKLPSLDTTTRSPKPGLASKFAFFTSSSNPSTPRPQTPPTQPLSRLRCRTTSTTTTTTTPSTVTLPNNNNVVQESPRRLQCKITNTPSTKSSTTTTTTGFFTSSSSTPSTPSSPRSPSTFSIIKNTLRLSKVTRCGICAQNVRTGQGSAIFTAECSHSFHFPCIASLANKTSGILLCCPVCGVQWKEAPILGVPKQAVKKPAPQADNLRLYDDDEPLMSPVSGIRFNPIPEYDEDDETEPESEFPGFFSDPNTPRPQFRNQSGLEIKISPEAAVVAVGRSYETYAVLMTIKAPPSPVATRRPSVDLVVVLDVGGEMNSAKLHSLKKAMGGVISSLSSNDRLSVVAFSSTSKRLLPLRRMTPSGRRSARRIVDALSLCQGSCANDALRKGAKVIQDRKEKNNFASIVLFKGNARTCRRFEHVSSTRFSHLEIPVHTFEIGDTYMMEDDMVLKMINSLLSVVVLDVRVSIGLGSGSAKAELAAVYTCTGRPGLLSSGSAKLGDLYSEEEREILVEMKVPASAIGSHHLLSVRSYFKDSSLMKQVIYGGDKILIVPRPHAIRSSNPSVLKLRSLFVMTRAVAESRRLVGERNDLSGAERLLGSARAVLGQPSLKMVESIEEYRRRVEAELAEVRWRRQAQPEEKRREKDGGNGGGVRCCVVDEKGEPLTPTSAWKAAERLAKVAVMRKSLNRVSDLHGFEDARF